MDVKRPFLHQHYLLFDRYDDQEATCDKCNHQIKNSKGWAYNCESCNFWLQQDCADELLPDEISHLRHSQHLLTLRSDEYDFVCRGCFTLSRGHRYTCNERNCDFTIEVLCASYTKDDALEKQGQRSDDSYKRTPHFSHDHALTLCKYRKVKSNDYSCRWCDKLLSGMCYGCLWWFIEELFFHESCLLDIPTRIFKHPFHPTHSLYIQSTENNSEAYCNACKNKIRNDAYNCRKCEFWLLCVCARPTLQPCLNHEFHEHSLSYFQTERSPAAFQCKRCDKKICTEDYPGAFCRCVRWDINLHFGCLQIPPTIQHGYHSHVLKLKESFVEHVSEKYYCDICEEKRNQKHPIYYCENCKYVAHVQCALNKIEHFTHGHPLQFYEVIEKNENLHCKACYLEITRQAYGCESCKYYLHKTWAKLSQEMQLPLHPQHPLKLIPNVKGYMCCQCRGTRTGFSYMCCKCDFKPWGSFAICCQCAISTTPKNESKIERKSKLCFFCKDKELFFFNVRTENFQDAKCNICCLPVSGPVYACPHCNYGGHEPCLGFPREIQLPNLQVSPLHPILVDLHHQCGACGGKFDYFTISYSYWQGENDLNFHLQCANSLRRAIKSDSHDQHHLFYFGTECQKLFFNNMSQFPSKNSFFKCSKCKEFFSREESFYRCLICDINFHLKCVPIPHSITSKCHIHPFSLKDYFVEDDSGKYYCDVCEEERDPKNHIYYCEECDGLFVAHIECIINQVEGIPSAEAFSNLDLYFQKILNNEGMFTDELTGNEDDSAAEEEPASDDSTDEE